MLRKLLIILLITLPIAVSAEQVIEHDGYRLHYMSMVTDELQPEVAKAYGITRSRKQGILILNLQHEDAPLVSVPSTTTGRIRNLIGQERLDDLREVREQDALYWIATFDFSHLETMRFEFQVKPASSKTSVPLKFSKQFYTPGR
ncbi:MAG: DUF4426 domain-containing protein [Oceanococcus sp.]